MVKMVSLRKSAADRSVEKDRSPPPPRNAGKGLKCLVRPSTTRF